MPRWLDDTLALPASVLHGDEIIRTIDDGVSKQTTPQSIATFTRSQIVVDDLNNSTTDAKSLIVAANYAAMRALLDLEVGIDVQAYDANLTTLAAGGSEARDLLGLGTMALESAADYQFVVRPDTFAGASDAAKMQACLTYAVANKVPVQLNPRTYEINADLAVTGDLVVLGVPGAVLDFSSKATWASGTSDGLFKISGTLGTAYSLAVGTRRQPVDDIRLSGTRSGTTITFTTTIAHGLSVNEPIWVHGATTSTAAGQRVFFTQSSGSSATRTTPFIVATVPDANTFTVTVADTGDTTLSVTAYLQFASDVIILSSTAGLSVGQSIKLRSDAMRTDGDNEFIRIGEHGIIARILPSINAVVLHAGVREAYLPADNAELVVTNLAKVVLRDFAVIGKGARTGSGYGDRGIVLTLTRNAIVEGILIRDVDQMAIYTVDCVAPEIRNNDIAFDAQDEAGSASLALDIQYGVGLGTGTEAGTVRSNHIQGGRHAIVQTGSGVSTFHGVIRDITVSDNTLRGQWLGAISTHMSVERWTIVGNKIFDAQTGLDLRYCDETIVRGNLINAFVTGIDLGNVIKSLDIYGNIIRAPLNGVLRTQPVGLNSWSGTLRVLDNDIESGRPIYIFDTSLTDIPTIICERNIVKGVRVNQAAIRIQTGDDSAGGWTGSVSANRIVGHPLDTAYTNAIWLQQPRNVRAHDNHVDGAGTWTRALYVAGARALNLDERSTSATIAPSTALVELAAGTGHRSESNPYEALTIASGAITVRPTTQVVRLSAEGGPGSDDLDVINGMVPGQRLSIFALSSSHVITVRDQATSSGNIQTASSASYTLSSGRDSVSVVMNNTEIVETSRVAG